ncbi:MAG TPA: Rrf2 family transcriptional regulator [Acidimicrobiales bacterium]|jgi:Rrf2 family protein|nr:Rrf2 family transcriptional regulator [Acidimicrobiales bacterium]
MRITAQVDYAVRALVELARREADPAAKLPVKAQLVAEAIGVPTTSLEDVLAGLRRSSIVRSQRGADGGWRLQLPAEDIDIARVIRAIEGPLAAIQGLRPDQLDYPPSDAALQRMWIAVRANLRDVLEHTTIADLRDGKLPGAVDALADPAENWLPH